MSFLRFAVALALLAATCTAIRSRCGQSTRDPKVQQFLECTCSEKRCNDKVKQFGEESSQATDACSACVSTCLRLSNRFTSFRNRKRRLQKAARRCAGKV